MSMTDLEQPGGPSPVVAALTSSAVAGITRLSAADTVRARIAIAIELGLLSAGEQLPSDGEIASALDVSEITVRRALKSLADGGVVVRRRGRAGGTFVADDGPHPLPIDAVGVFRADAAQVHRLIDQRALLECALAHHAALAVTDAQITELQAVVEQCATAKDWSAYHAADERFHRGLAAASGLEWALPHYDEALAALYRYFIPYPVEYLHGANEDHAALVEALRNHDPVTAVTIIERHVLVLHETMFVGLG